MSYPISFYFTSNQLWIENIVAFYDDCDVGVFKELDDNDQYMFGFSSPHIDALSDDEEIETRAFSLLALLNGYVSFFFGKQRRLSFSEVYSSRDRTTKRMEYRDPNPLSVFDDRAMTEQPEREHFKKMRSSHLSTTLYTARYDDLLLNPLLSVGMSDVSWPSLYLVYENMRKGGFSDKRLNEMFPDEPNWVNHFTATANHPALSGPTGRHAIAKGQKPNLPPMKLSSAEEFIFGAFKEFVETRIRKLERSLGLDSPN